jgi:hypothetical protein
MTGKHLCRVCRRETESKWGTCHRAGKCNAARQAAIREHKRQEQQTLNVKVAETIALALESTKDA